MKVCAFIFARGGSKGLPGKNIKLLHGKTLLQRSVEMAKQCDFVNAVYVSTDDNAIATEAVKHGAAVIHRPEHLATDNASEWLAWQHAIKSVDQRCEIFLSLPTTAPLRVEQDVRDCISVLEGPKKPDIVVTMSEASRSPFFNMVARSESGIRVVCHDPKIIRRQDAPEVFDLTTVAYAARPQYILDSTSLFAGKVEAVVIPKERAIDIDDIHDFEVAEFLIRKRETP